MRDSIEQVPNAPQWQLMTQTITGGRVTDVEATNDSIWFAGTASGGVFKSSDKGKTWTPIFDQQPSLSIGDIAIAADPKQTIYVGTGEANAGGGSITYDGIGLFKSSDKGNSWQSIGLQNTGTIAEIVVEQNNPQTIWVAAMGQLFANNPQRGVFKTTDAGNSWQHCLHISDSTGCADLALHPNNPNIAYAAMWERIRRPDQRRYGGLSSAIYKTNDGGKNWQKLYKGLPQQALGRIAIAIMPQKPSTLFALCGNPNGNIVGLFQSNNDGETWQPINTKGLNNELSDYNWWFGRLIPHPNKPNTLFLFDIALHISENNGKTWRKTSPENVHCDQHSICFLDRNKILLANDGGVYYSDNSAKTWHETALLPIGQLYDMAINSQNPPQWFGALQDNGIAQWKNNQLQINQEGDGLAVAINPKNENQIWMSFQYGELYLSNYNGNNWKRADDGIFWTDCFPWKAPLAFDANGNLWTATNRLYKCPTITPRNSSRWRVMLNQQHFSNYGPNENINGLCSAIVAIACAPTDTNRIYWASNYGHIWTSKDAGKSSTKTNADQQLPPFYVSSLTVNPLNANTLYATLSGYRYNQYNAQVWVSHNAGSSWKNLSKTLPPTPINDLLIIPTDTNTLYIASDIGVFIQKIKQQKCQLFGKGMPIVPTTKLQWHKPSNRLYVATYGRGTYIIDLKQ